MKKILLFIILFLFSISLVSASDLVFNDWVYHQGNITLDDLNFHFRISSEGNTLYVKSGADYIILNKETCKKFDSKTQVCFNDSYYEEAGSTNNKAYVRFYYTIPKLNISRTIDDNIFNVGQEANFEVIIYNTGDVSATDAYYADEFPPNIVVKSSSNCQHDEHKVFWEGSISAGSSYSCSYTITTTDSIDATTISRVSYNDGFQNRINYSSLIRIYSTSVLSINSSFKNSSLEIGQETEFNINLTNRGDEEIYVSNFTVKIPSGLNVTYSSIRKEKENLYSWSGTLYSNNSEDITIKVVGLKAKSSEVIMNARYEVDDELYDVSNIKNNILVENKGIELSSNLLTTEHVDSGTEKNIFFTVRNLNNYTDLQNIVLDVNSTLFPSGKYLLSTLGDSSYKKIMDITIKTPDVDSTQMYLIKANVTYETLYGDRSSAALERTIYIEPIKKLVIEKSISSTSIEEKKEALVTVKIRNDRNADVENVEVREIFSGGFSQRGTTSATIPKIENGETETAYTYTIIAPDVINETSYSINTSVSYLDAGQKQTFFSELGFKVIPKKIKITVTKRVSDTEIYLGEILNIFYTIKNEETEAAKNLVLVFSENEKFDSINVFEYSLASLNPGQEVLVEKEQIRPKETSDKLVMDGSVLYYEDMNGAKFNTTSDSLSLKIQDTYITGPMILIEKSADIYVINKSDEISIKNTIKNIGDEAVVLTIYDDGMEWTEAIGPNSETVLTYKKRIYDVGEVSLPKVYAYYNFIQNKYKVTSNVVMLKVIDPAVPVEKQAEQETQQEAEEEEIIIPAKKTQKNFFVKLWDDFIGIFKFLRQSRE